MTAYLSRKLVSTGSILATASHFFRMDIEVHFHQMVLCGANDVIFTPKTHSSRMTFSFYKIPTCKKFFNPWRQWPVLDKTNQGSECWQQNPGLLNTISLSDSCHTRCCLIYPQSGSMRQVVTKNIIPVAFFSSYFWLTEVLLHSFILQWNILHLWRRCNVVWHSGLPQTITKAFYFRFFSTKMEFLPSMLALYRCCSMNARYNAT